ncbi:peptidase C39 family protein [Candidatus Woesearchaeota archaeon]|nr:peptidase C39 family protein [Candidatus Woesearchaeota archaeon]
MKVYKATTPFSRATSALLTVMHHYKPGIPLTRELEFSMWQRSASLPVLTSSIFALASLAHDAGIKVHVVVGDLDYKFPDYRFQGYTKQEIQDAEFSAKIHYDGLLKRGVEVEEKEFTLDDVKYYLRQGKIILLRLNAGVLRDTKSVSNYIIVTAYKDKIFHCIDPIIGEEEVPRDKLEHAFVTLETIKKRDNRMIIFG